MLMMVINVIQVVLLLMLMDKSCKCSKFEITFLIVIHCKMI